MVRGLGERLQKQRQKLKLSQKEVAKVIGISPSIISLFYGLFAWIREGRYVSYRYIHVE